MRRRKHVKKHPDSNRLQLTYHNILISQNILSTLMNTLEHPRTLKDLNFSCMLKISQEISGYLIKSWKLKVEWIYMNCISIWTCSKLHIAWYFATASATHVLWRLQCRVEERRLGTWVCSVKWCCAELLHLFVCCMHCVSCLELHRWCCCNLEWQSG